MNNFSDNHQYTIANQEIKEQVIYMTEVLKGDRNFLNKHFQNAITNYFMEDYASQFLKEKMGLKTFKEVKQVIAQKLEEKQKSDNSGTKYMNLINIYHDEHTKQGTFEQYQNSLKQLVLSNDNKHYPKGSSEWITISWKKATALFVFHHSQNRQLSSIFEIWNSLFPENPIIKKKKTREEREKEKQKDSLKDNDSLCGQDSTVKKTKKTIQKIKTPIKRSSLTKQKEIQTMKKNKQNSIQSENDDNNYFGCSERDNSYSESNRDQTTKSIQKKKTSNKGKKEVSQDYEQYENELIESTYDVKDSIHLYKEKIKLENRDDGFEEFPAFEYIPMSVKQNQDNNNVNCQYIQPINSEKLKEEYLSYGYFGGMEIEQSKEKEFIFKSLVLAKELSQQNNEKNQNLNNLQYNHNLNNHLQQPISFENEDFFSRNMTIFQDIGFGDFNNEMQMFESQKNNPLLKLNLPVFNSLTLSAMNINNNNTPNLNLFSNHNQNGHLQQQNVFNSQQQYVNNSLFFKITDKNEQKNNLNFQTDFDRLYEEQDQGGLLFDLAETQDFVYNQSKFDITKKEHDDEFTDEEKFQNEDDFREVKEFLNQINAIPVASQKLMKESNIQKSSDFNINSQDETQTETHHSQNIIASNLITSSQFFLRNIS